MEVPVAPRASSTAWTTLLHAEVAFLLDQAGIRVLQIKGPSVADWLYAPGERPGGDIDVLVSPGEIEQALDALRRSGFVERFAGVDRGATTDHAVAMYRPQAETGYDEIDVHDRFPGIDLDPSRAFELLWRHREPAQLAHCDVWFPDLPTRAILIALNTARTRNGKTLEDLVRLLRADVEWDLVIALAGRLEALGALRAGLELDPVGEAIIGASPLAGVEVPRHWRMRLSDAPRTALRLDELSDLPWRKRVTSIVRWLFPPPAVLRMRDERAGTGRVGLADAYVRRIAQGVRALPASRRALRSMRRG